jgi:phosphate transport system permease protein
MKFDRPARRKIFSHGMTVLSGLSVVVILIPLIAVVYECVVLGGSVFNVTFFTHGIPYPCSPRPGVTCQQGGIAPAIQGTFIMMGLASLVAVPIGVGAAIFAVEYGGQRAAARVIGMAADVLAGVPSIVAGVFIYSLMVIYDPTITFSTLSGGLALSIIMVPIVTRTTEEALRTVPNSVREAALALGISRWKTSVRIVLIAALPGVLTGILLGFARAAGDAAALLIVDGGGLYGFTGWGSQVAAVPIWMFIFADSPDQNWITLAWGAGLFLILLCLGLSLISRYVLSRMARRMRGE